MLIIKDTREKVGSWDFDDQVCEGMVTRKLDTGDYAIDGLEDILCLERKRNVAELCVNVFEERFKRELERMAKYPYKYMIFEFTIDDIRRYPVGSNIPKSRWSSLKVTGNYVMRFIADMEINYGIHCVFAGCKDNAIFLASNIMKRVYVKHAKNP